jgi:hypothetical protein
MHLLSRLLNLALRLVEDRKSRDQYRFAQMRALVEMQHE